MQVIKMQVYNLHKCPQDEIVIKVRVCQQQTNALGCGGVYSAAKLFIYYQTSILA